MQWSDCHLCTQPLVFILFQTTMIKYVFFSKKINTNSDKAEAPSRTIQPVLLVLLSRQPVWDDNLMVEVESRADVAAGQHDFLSQVAAVILEVGRGAGWSQVVKWICLISSDPERKMWRKWTSVNVNVPAALSSRSQTLASYSICFHWLSSYVMHLFSFQQCEILKDGLREQGRSLAWAKSMPCRKRIHTRKVAFPSGVGNRSDVWWEWHHLKWKHSKTKKTGAQCLQGQISCSLLFFLQKTVSFTSKHKDCFGSSWFKRLSWLVFCPMGGFPLVIFCFCFCLSYRFRKKYSNISTKHSLQTDSV